ncbi:MAG: putative thermolysin family peptidase, partial [Acidimicrobiales bacterium]|nr:putative thermolysin family peptidase [Acidimicrobiales bacterium]
MKRGSRTLGTIVVLLAGLASMSIEVVSTSATSAGASSDKRDDDGGASNSALESQLRTDTSGQATFGIREATGDVTYIGGSAAHPLQAKTRGGQDDAARQFVDAYASLFGVTDTKTNLLQTQSFVGSDGTGGAVKFQQTYNGIPVIAGVLAIQVAASGAVLSATGEASSDLSIDTTPAISVEQAVTSSVAGVARRAAVDPTTLSADAPVLSIYDPTLLGAPDTLGPRLVWQLNVTDGGLGTVDYYVLIDAQQGTVALQFDQHEAVLNRSVCDNANNRALSETCTAPVVRSEGQGPTGATDVDNAYDLSGITYGFYMSHFGRDSVDGAGLPLKSTVRFCYPASTGLACPYANAFWDGSQMVYGDGFANADDVVGHELTHGVTQYTSGLFYYGASGAINESMSDVMGEFIDQANITPADMPSTKWKLGEDLIIGAIRDMKNPPFYG